MPSTSILQPEQINTMSKSIKIGTRDSELALWQANTVKALLEEKGFAAELVLIKSEGDLDLTTPLYAMGVQGVFTRSLDIALLNGRIDIAVHSMKDVPTQLPKGIAQAAILKRASHTDILVYNGDPAFLNDFTGTALIATSSIRRKAQWLHRYPHHSIENLRGNVNTRLRKVAESNWNGAVFAAAGLERIHLRPQNSIDLDWMLPAPAQGAIMVVCGEADTYCREALGQLNDRATEIATKVERDFLKELMGGCSTPISGLATVVNNCIQFKGSILSLDGKEKAEIEISGDTGDFESLGAKAAAAIIANGGKSIAESIKNAGK